MRLKKIENLDIRVQNIVMNQQTFDIIKYSLPVIQKFNNPLILGNLYDNITIWVSDNVPPNQIKIYCEDGYDDGFVTLLVLIILHTTNQKRI